MTNNKTPSYIKISTQYRKFRKNIYSIWESYNLVDFYSKIIREEIGNNKKALLIASHLKTSGTKTYDKNNTLNLLDRFHQQETPRRALIESIGLFEDFIGLLITLVYKDYPRKLLGKDEQEDSSIYHEKILKTVIQSNNKDEILTKIIEDRVRSLFYENPSDFFLKNKTKLEFGDFFKKKLKAINQYIELTARRNIIVHNGGKIDRKYLREVENSEFTLNENAEISADYLRNSIILLEGLGAATSVQVLNNIYKQDFADLSKKLQQSFVFFERSFGT